MVRNLPVGTHCKNRAVGQNDQIGAGEQFRLWAEPGLTEDVRVLLCPEALLVLRVLVDEAVHCGAVDDERAAGMPKEALQVPVEEWGIPSFQVQLKKLCAGNRIENNNVHCIHKIKK